MRKLLRFLLYTPIVRLANRYSSHPDRTRVFQALSSLRRSIAGGIAKSGPLVAFDLPAAKFIIFSDQHKGARDGADDFAMAEPNYLAALDYYDAAGFHFVSLGDNEELWENSVAAVKKHNVRVFAAEQSFVRRGAFTKIFGNHDLYWDNDPFAAQQLREIYGQDVPVYEGILLTTRMRDKDCTIFCTHGHQGDRQSDGNWFSKMFISLIWGPLQSFLRINPNLPSTNDALKTVHNQMMYEWSAQQQQLLLITGHTHQPVFESMTHIENLYVKLEEARQGRKALLVASLEEELRLQGHAVRQFGEVRPTYFNSGCCCFDDGDITGIEITDGMIRLIKWDRKKSGNSLRIILEETSLDDLFQKIAGRNGDAGSEGEEGINFSGSHSASDKGRPAD